MANRHLARSVALQTLYEWDFGGQKERDADKITDRTAKEFAPELGGDAFARQLVNGVMQKQPQLDRVIGKAAPEWPIEQITPVDRNILRLGLWELLFGNKDEVPPRVAINEAIELAKTFGSHSSGRFVNGVLGTVYRQLGEEAEQLAGAVVFRRKDSSILFAIIRDAFDYWTFVKGHIKQGESKETAAVRELKEELGIGGTIAAALGEMSYLAAQGDRQVKRTVQYYLVETDDETLKLEQSSGLKEARWVALEEFKTLKRYENQEEIVEKAMAYLKPKTKN